MKTAVEWLVAEIEKDSDIIFYDRNLHPYEKYIEQAKEMEKEQSYNLDDLRNAYRWGITATIGTSDHFEEFVNNIKSE